MSNAEEPMPPPSATEEQTLSAVVDSVGPDPVENTPAPPPPTPAQEEPPSGEDGGGPGPTEGEASPDRQVEPVPDSRLELEPDSEQSREPEPEPKFNDIVELEKDGYPRPTSEPQSEAVDQPQEMTVEAEPPTIVEPIREPSPTPEPIEVAVPVTESKENPEAELEASEDSESAIESTKEAEEVPSSEIEPPAGLEAPPGEVSPAPNVVEEIEELAARVLGTVEAEEEPPAEEEPTADSDTTVKPDSHKESDSKVIEPKITTPIKETSPTHSVPESIKRWDTTPPEEAAHPEEPPKLPNKKAKARLKIPKVVFTALVGHELTPTIIDMLEKQAAGAPA